MQQSNASNLKRGDTLLIKVGEHMYETPAYPGAAGVLFTDKRKSEQYWSREYVLEDIPDYFFKWTEATETEADYTIEDGGDLKSLSRKDTKKLIELRDRELGRMVNGVWFMNHGTPTYITGCHYGALMWCAMKGSKNDVDKRSTYGKYMRFQRDYCYFIDIIKNTPHARGGDVVKPKKTGITQLQSLIILIDSMLNRTSIQRMMSTKEDVARDSCFSYIVYALEKFPAVLCPSVSKQNLSEVKFGEPDPSRARFRKRKVTDTEYLNSWITTVPTVKNAFDSLTNFCAWIDEQSKIKEGAYPKETHDITIATVMQGLDRYGYVIYTHYVSETNDRSFDEARTIYYESKLSTIDKATGQTKSKLLCYAMTVLDGIFGACDKYGEPELDKIWAEINSQHNALKNDPNKLQAFRRQQPISEDDCWQEGAGEGSIFDNVRLAVKLKQLQMDAGVGVYPYMDFNFNWSIQPKIDDVNQIYEFRGTPLIVPVTDDQKMEGKTHGLFKWYRREWTPDVFLEKHLYKTDIHPRTGKLKPREGCPFYAAADPTGYANRTDVVVGSKNALQVFILPSAEVDSMVGQRVSNRRLMVEYLHRPERPSEFLMAVVQTILTFGCYILIENNQAWLATKLKEWGFENFLIVLSKEGVLEPYREYGEQKPFSSQKETIGQYVTTGRQFLAPPEMDTDLDPITHLDSESVIKQLMKFDPTNTKAYDAAVCFLIGQNGIEQHLGWYYKNKKKASATGGGTIKGVFEGIIAR